MRIQYLPMVAVVSLLCACSIKGSGEAKVTVATSVQIESGPVVVPPTPPGDEGPVNAPPPEFVHSYFGTIRGTMQEGPISVKPAKQNVILVVIDALNASHVGAYGYDRDTTPHIDKLAEDGVLFTNWVSSSSWTRPAFTTLLTGVPKSDHGMELGEAKLKNSLVTLAEHFQKAGYRTGAFIGNPLIGKQWNYQQGFDVFEDSAEHGPFPRAKVLVDRAIAWLEGSDPEKPYFLCLFLTDPHAPYSAPPEWRHFSGGFDDIVEAPPREVLAPYTEQDLEKIVAAYDDEVAYADHEVGRLVNWLAEQPSPASVVLTADHGEIFGEHNCFQHAYHMWEPVVRVPFIVASPGVAPTGVATDMPAGHVDLLPTLLALADLPKAEGMPGASVFSLSEGERQRMTTYDARGVKRTTARQGSWKLVRYEKVSRKRFESIGKSPLDRNPSLQLPGPRYELFDVERDRAEMSNVYEANQEDTVVRALRKLLRPAPRPKKKVDAPIDPETLEALKAAGYIQ